MESMVTMTAKAWGQGDAPTSPCRVCGLNYWADLHKTLCRPFLCREGERWHPDTPADREGGRGECRNCWRARKRERRWEATRENACPKGHPKIAENTGARGGCRRCSEITVESRRRQSHARKARESV